MSQPELTLCYVHGQSIGYGRLGVELAAGLQRRSVEVYDELAGDKRTMLQNVERYHNRKGQDADFAPRRAKPTPTNLALWVAHPMHATRWFEGQHAAIFTMWETQKLPETFIEGLHNFDTVLVPCEYNRDLFSEYHDNVHVVPLGVDPTVWKYTPRQDSRFFNFLIAGSGRRKGTDLAYRAFQKVFGDWGPDWKGGDREPTLRFKSPVGEDYVGERISQTTGRVPAAEEVGIYEEAHCYLQPSRGEGFGLQPLQALAQGIPTILTDAHGQADYAALGYGISATSAKADYFIAGASGDWWEPDFDELCEAMWDVYSRYDRYLVSAERSARTIAASYTWDHMVDKVQAVLGEEFYKPYTGSGAEFVPSMKLFEVVTTVDRTCDIGGTIYRFVAGEPQRVSVDVKRTLFESGIVDPICLVSDDHGLLPEQMERVPRGTDEADVLFRISEAVEPWQVLAGRVIGRRSVSDEDVEEYQTLLATV